MIYESFAMNKHRLFLIKSILAVIPLAVFAADPVGNGFSRHLPRDFEKLNPDVSLSASAISLIDSSRRLVNFNPALFYSDPGNSAGIYISGDTVNYVQFATKHRFIQNSREFAYSGFENRATRYSLNEPLPVMKFPSVENGTVQANSSGSVTGYGGILLKLIKGRSTGNVSAGWTLTDGNDTVRDAKCLVWELDTKYLDPDSVAGEWNDSISQESVSDYEVDVRRLLSERLLTRRMIWFTDDARYPILQQSTVSRLVGRDSKTECDTVPVSVLSMFYTPECQHADTGEGNDEKKRGNDENNDGESPDDTGNMIAAGDPEFSNESISIPLSSKDDALEAILTLYSDSGIRLSEPVAVILTAIPQTFCIPVPSDYKGILLIRIDAGEQSLTRKAVV